jgi:hypothetical protein
MCWGRHPHALHVRDLGCWHATVVTRKSVAVARFTPSCLLHADHAHSLSPAGALDTGSGLGVSGRFFGFISVALFSYLGRPGSITSGRLYASVSLYVILGIFFYTLFNLVELIYPGSLQESGLGPAGSVTRHTLSYLSLVTLTTLGYGDITPVSPPAGMLAAFEAVVGILYIAITVARLVAAYQSANRK